MTIAITFSWWAIPTAITAIAIAWALFWPANDGGYMGGITRLFMLIPALFVSLLVWVVAAVMK